MKNHSSLRTLVCLVLAVALTLAVGAGGGGRPANPHTPNGGGRQNEGR